MSRPPRIIIVGQPLHVIQRGNDRIATFRASSDFAAYKAAMQEASARDGCAVHAYVLMTNHIHLLVTPQKERSIAATMQTVGRRYVRYFNDRYERTGTLWEGRFRSTLIDSERYFLTCSRYIELNPVRAGMVDRPEQYAWSSFAHNALGVADDFVTQHHVYNALGARDSERRVAYRELFQQSLDEASINAIREASNSGRVLGEDVFRERIETFLGRRTPTTHGGDRRKVSRQVQNSTTLTP